MAQGSGFVALPSRSDCFICGDRVYTVKEVLWIMDREVNQPTVRVLLG